MKNLSIQCELSQIYTNHSLRVTGSAILGRNKCSDAQIMSVTGHKSVSSLSIYQRITDEEKLEMSRLITSATTSNEPGVLGKWRFFFAIFAWRLHIQELDFTFVWYSFFFSGTAVLADIGNIHELKKLSCTVTSSSSWKMILSPYWLVRKIHIDLGKIILADTSDTVFIYPWQNSPCVLVLNTLSYF